MPPEANQVQENGSGGKADRSEVSKAVLVPPQSGCLIHKGSHWARNRSYATDKQKRSGCWTKKLRILSVAFVLGKDIASASMAPLTNIISHFWTDELRGIGTVDLHLLDPSVRCWWCTDDLPSHGTWADSPPQRAVDGYEDVFMLGRKTMYAISIDIDRIYELSAGGHKVGAADYDAIINEAPRLVFTVDKEQIQVFLNMMIEFCNERKFRSLVFAFADVDPLKVKLHVDTQPYCSDTRKYLVLHQERFDQLQSLKSLGMYTCPVKNGISTSTDEQSTIARRTSSPVKAAYGFDPFDIVKGFWQLPLVTTSQNCLVLARKREYLRRLGFNKVPATRRYTSSSRCRRFWGVHPPRTQDNWSIVENKAYHVVRACSNLTYLLELYYNYTTLIHIFASDTIKPHLRGKLQTWVLHFVGVRFASEHIQDKDSDRADIVSRWHQSGASTTLEIAALSGVPILLMAALMVWNPHTYITTVILPPSRCLLISIFSVHANEDSAFLVGGKLWMSRETRVLVQRPLWPIVDPKAIIAPSVAGWALLDCKCEATSCTISILLRQCKNLKGGKVEACSWGLTPSATKRNTCQHLDYLYPGESYEDSKYVLALKDELNDYCELVAVDSATSYATVEAVLAWHKHFGLPDMWVSDNGTNFYAVVGAEIVERMKATCKRNGLKGQWNKLTGTSCKFFVYCSWNLSYIPITGFIFFQQPEEHRDGISWWSRSDRAIRWVSSPIPTRHRHSGRRRLISAAGDLLDYSDIAA
ncbi:LOW QUALITY PROTEIN: hypothetical protein PHMEG_00013221 [Phytophthora megakarya]|uniref:Integrase catalytic domain-containing protein n=1 Tax=Phytophthora megakarya TaxID=4795 RepID=A0A225W8A2_9STRA|nr:LOW QUALITY PROTEIN: hypothetical protein PHMEG_00013221 [Phytophthora megakarya]